MRLGQSEGRWYVGRSPASGDPARPFWIGIHLQPFNFGDFFTADELRSLAAEIDDVLEDVATSDVVTEPF